MVNARRQFSTELYALGLDAYPLIGYIPAYRTGASLPARASGFRGGDDK